MGNGIYFKIAGYVDLDVLIILIPCQIFDIINGFCPVSKVAAITKNRNFFKWPKLLYFKPESAQI
jgi:hypothetical protein